VVDGSGGVIWSGACATDPDVLAKTLKTRAPGLVRVILETGALSAFLYHGLVEHIAVTVYEIDFRLRNAGDLLRPLFHTKSLQFRCHWNPETAATMT
jgi:hypothetical protein